MPLYAEDADRLDHIARKLRTYLGVYTGDKEAREMAAWCQQRAEDLRKGYRKPSARSRQAWDAAPLSQPSN